MTTPPTAAGTVAFIGLGIMGKPMADNLAAAGYHLRVHNRTRSVMQELDGDDLARCESPAQAAEGADVIITMLSDEHAVREVLLGSGSVSEGARRGAVVVDMSTIPPATARSVSTSLEDHGLAFVDAPVSGGEPGAIAGTLAIMAGGEPAAFEAVRPVLECLGKTVTHLGGVGAGQVTKACNQIVLGLTLLGIGEALTLAERLGVAPARVRDALLGGSVQSRLLDVKGKKIVERSFEPGFRAELHHKDLGIVLSAARSSDTPLLGTALVEQLLRSLVAEGDGGLDNCALALVVERLAGGRP